LATKKVDVIQVVQHGEQLVIPENLPLPRAVEVLQRKIEYDEQKMAINAKIDGFIFDAAHAFHVTLTKMFGWANNVPTPGFFGPQPPQLITVPIGPGESVQVPWGRFQLPGIDGYLQTGAVPDFTLGRFSFVIGGEVKRKHEAQINTIVENTKRELRENSVYKGKAFRIRLRDDDGEPIPLPEPRFLDLNPRIEQELVFSDEVMAALEVNVFSQIEYTEEIRQLKEPLKRGVLLSGKYGTGKSMTSSVTAIKCVRNGWTFIAAERADELADICRLAREYGPAVVFCEDIDRVLSGDRSIDMDTLLNIVDGVESKNAELMVVLTTNHVENIHRAMLRPGRLDAVILVEPPDAKATERLMRLYAYGLIDENEDISAAAELLAGETASVMREAVSRAKRAAVFAGVKPAEMKIDADALLRAAQSLKPQLKLLNTEIVNETPELVQAAEVIRDGISKIIGGANKRA